MPNLPEPNTDSAFELLQGPSRAADPEKKVTEDWPEHEAAGEDVSPPAESTDIEGVAPSGPIVQEGTGR